MAADSEIYRLRNTLYGSGWELFEVDEIIDQATRDVNELVLDVVENAVAEAVDHAQQLGAEDFINEMDIRESGGYYHIATISGNMDYSTPEKQMLPHLIKNAPENPNTGNKNRVIPVGQSTKSAYGDIFSVMQSRQKQLQEARESLIENNLNSRSDRATGMASHFRSIMQRNLASKRTEKKITVGNSVNTTFRTASSKQDPSSDWVIPAKEMDMTTYVLDLNDKITRTLDSAVTQLINSYIQEFS